MRLLYILPFPMLLLSGCYTIAPSDGGGQTHFDPPRNIVAGDIALPSGYKIEAIASGLTYPSGVAVDDQDRVYVLEAGYSYGPEFKTPRLLRVTAGGGTEEIARGDKAPWTGMSFYQGVFYVSQGGHHGRVVRISMDGVITPLVENLPSFGDHHTNRPVVGPDGLLYFSQGTATNSGVVGEDNFKFGWLKDYPDFRDIPAKDITLVGQNFRTKNPLTDNPDDEALTGAYLPFGAPSTPGQVIRGALPCTGAIMRLPTTGGAVELVAWGLRNPFGLAFAPDGTLYTTENGMDVRGSRPAFGCPDFLYRVEAGKWYGWPDYVGGEALNEEEFSEASTPQPKFLLAEHPGTPPKPVASLGVHSSSNGFDFSRNAVFGYAGQAFVAQFGDMAPGVGKVLHPVGFKVVRVDVESGEINDFAVNKGPQNAPASKLGGGGLERPVDLRFNNDGTILYVVDFGVMTVDGEGPAPREGTGVLWRVTRQAK